jgi:hypothetical protein
MPQIRRLRIVIPMLAITDDRAGATGAGKGLGDHS